MKYYCGVDTGGTFTDCVVVDGGGRITIAKRPSTPKDYSQGFLDALRRRPGAASARGGVQPEHCSSAQRSAPTRSCRCAERRPVSSRPGVTAMLIMRSTGAPWACRSSSCCTCLATASPPIVPRRADPGGRARRLGGRSVRAAQRAGGAPAVALLVARSRRRSPCACCGDSSTGTTSGGSGRSSRVAPDVFVSCSHELIAKRGEYERGRGRDQLLHRAVDSELPSAARVATHELGYEKPMLMMQAAGGVVPCRGGRGAHVHDGSGPVGGRHRGLFLGRAMARANVIICDMGGTSFEAGILRDGRRSPRPRPSSTSTCSTCRAC